MDTLFEANLNPAERAQSRLVDAVIELAKEQGCQCRKSPEGLYYHPPSGVQYAAMLKREAAMTPEERQEEVAKDKRYAKALEARMAEGETF